MGFCQRNAFFRKSQSIITCFRSELELHKVDALVANYCRYEEMGSKLSLIRTWTWRSRGRGLSLRFTILLRVQVANGTRED